MKGSNNERKDHIKGPRGKSNRRRYCRSMRDKGEDTIIDTETGSRRRTSMLSLSLSHSIHTQPMILAGVLVVGEWTVWYSAVLWSAE